MFDSVGKVMAHNDDCARPACIIILFSVSFYVSNIIGHNYSLLQFVNALTSFVKFNASYKYK